MVYLTIKDIKARISAEKLNIITQGDTDVLNNEELDAVSIVMSYLAHDYDTSLIFQPIDTPDYTMHPAIKRMTIDIMVYNMHNSKINPRQIPENIIALKRDATDWLADVADPETKTNAPFLPKKTFENEKRNNSFAWGSAPKRDNSY